MKSEHVAMDLPVDQTFSTTRRDVFVVASIAGAGLQR